MKTAWFGLLAGALAVSAGCKENATASAACSTQADTGTCETCCKANGANGYKFSSGSCSCLGGKEKAAVAPAAPPPPVAAAPQPVQPVQQPLPATPIGVNAGAFSIPKTTFVRGEPVVVTFLRDMTTPPGQQHWITLAKPTDVESAWGAWKYVPQSAKSEVLTPPTPGEWEIRLHDLYPRWASRVIARQRITVQ